MPKRQEFITFYSPGTFVAETTTKEIASRDTHEAARLAKKITERHGAKPYGFRFETQIVADLIPDGEGGTLKVQNKTINTSGMFFLGGRILTYDEIPATRENDTLRINMRGNRRPMVVENTNSFRSTMPFDSSDVLLDQEGNVMRRGDAPDLEKYRAAMIEVWKAEAEAEAN